MSHKHKIGAKVIANLKSRGSISGVVHKHVDMTYEKEPVYVISAVTEGCPILVFGVPESFLITKDKI